MRPLCKLRVMCNYMVISIFSYTAMVTLGLELCNMYV